MLLSGPLRYVLMFGGGALAIAAFGIWRALRRYVNPLPDAKVVSPAGTRRRLLVRIAPPIAIVVGLVLLYWSYTHDIEYVIVREGSNGPTVVRRYGADRTTDVALAPGVKPLNSENSLSLDPVWVINKSAHTLRVKSVYYGRSLGFGAEPTIIPPNTSAHFNRIDYIGPFDEPPSTVTDETKLGMSYREWLTWDP